MKMQSRSSLPFQFFILTILLVGMSKTALAAPRCRDIVKPLIGKKIAFAGKPIDEIIAAAEYRWPESDAELRETSQVQPLKETGSITVHAMVGEIKRQYKFIGNGRGGGFLSILEVNLDSKYPMVPRTFIAQVSSRYAPFRYMESLGPVETAERWAELKSFTPGRKTVRSAMIYRIQPFILPTAQLNEIGIFEFTDGTYAVVTFRDPGRFNSDTDFEITRHTPPPRHLE